MKISPLRADEGDRLFAAARWLVFATALVPVVVVPGFFFPFITVRSVFFRVAVEIASSIVLYLVTRRHVTLNFRADVVFWALAGWVGANALAAAVGAAPIRSFFGDHERMGGVWFWLHLLAFYVVSRTVLRPPDWWRLFRIAVAIASVISIYGLIQYRFPWFGSEIRAVDYGVTVGNPGLLAVYLLANVALCALLACRAGARGRLGYAALATVILLAMVFSGNRSSTLALFVGSGAALIAYTAWTGSLRGPRGVLIVAIFACPAALPFVSRIEWARPITAHVPILGRLSSGVDSTRVVQWRAAVDGIRSRPILGFGPENYQIIWSRYYHPEMYSLIGESTWDRAHNAYLDAFATAGILGFLSLLAIWLALAYSANQAARRGEVQDESAKPVVRAGAVEAIALGFFVAYAFYLFFWFFDLNSTMLWIALGAFVASRATGAPLIEIGALREKRWQSTVILGLGAIALVAVLYVHGYKTLEMARSLNRAGQPDQPFHQTLADYESVFASPAPFTQHSFVMYAAFLRSSYSKFEEIRGDPARAALFDRAFALAMGEFERQAVQDPLNDQVPTYHARVLMLGAYYYGNQRLYEAAIAKLQHAVMLAPRKVTTRLLVGAAYLTIRRPKEALEALERAYAVYPRNVQTMGYLASAHHQDGNAREAARWLHMAMDFNYLHDHTLTMHVARDLANAGEPLAGARLAKRYVVKKRGAAFPGDPGGSWDVSVYKLAVIASELFAEGGDAREAAALKSAAEMLCFRPTPINQLRIPLRAAYGEAADCRQPWRTGAMF